MKFLADENFPKTSYLLLKEAGYDITSIGLCHFGVTDEEVLHIAREEKRTILTFDSDFGKLIFKDGHICEAGVLFFRWINFSSEEPGALLIQMLKEGTVAFHGFLTVIDQSIDSTSYTIRQRPIRP